MQGCLLNDRNGKARWFENFSFHTTVDFSSPIFKLIGWVKLEFFSYFSVLSGSFSLWAPGNSSKADRLYWLIHLHSLQSMCSLEASAPSSLRPNVPEYCPHSECADDPSWQWLQENHSIFRIMFCCSLPLRLSRK